MTLKEFWTRDSRFGLRISSELVQQITKVSDEAADNETGGILIGHYAPAHDCAEVTAVTGPPPDSRAGRTWFERGIAGLRRRLKKLWNERREYYLGEWHLHPGGAPYPSATDDQRMQSIARTKQYHCPEPVLLLVGGPSLNRQMRVFVYPNDSPRMELEPGSYAPR